MNLIISFAWTLSLLFLHASSCSDSRISKNESTEKYQEVVWRFGDLWDGDSGKVIAPDDTASLEKADLEVHQDAAIGVYITAIGKAKIFSEQGLEKMLPLQSNTIFKVQTAKNNMVEVYVISLEPLQPNVKTLVVRVKHRFLP